MKLKLPRDFTPSRPQAEEVFERYGDRVSPEIIELWRQTGLGSFANGFIKVINPLAVAGAFERLFEGSPVSRDVPLFATAFGDLITYGDEFDSYHESYGAGTFYGINFKRRIISEVGVRLPYLLHDLTGGFFQREMFNPEGYVAAKHGNRRLHLHECYVPSASGGKYGIMELSEFIDEAPRGAFGEG